MSGGTGAAGMGPAPVTYAFYLDGYGGTLPAEAFAEAMPAALRCVGGITGRRIPDKGWDDVVADAWRRAVCAAAEAFAEFGEGRVGGFEIGDFKVTNYQEQGTTGAEVAHGAALAELAGTGLAWSGVR